MWKECLAFVLIASTCAAGTINPSVPDGKYIEYGSRYKCVVPIYGKCHCGRHSDDPHEFRASAVVIDKRWVLTAAHVVLKSSKVAVKVGEQEHLMKRVIVNRMFNEDVLGRYDIAMCESEDDMDMDFYPPLYEEDNESGKVSAICGYGITGNFSTGAVRSDGKKRAGSNIVHKVENHVLVCSVTDPRTTELEFMIAPGDSGGGLFIDQKLAGINSFVVATDGKSNSDYGDECCHTRISVFVPWIKANMRGDAAEDEITEQGSGEPVVDLK